MDITPQDITAGFLVDYVVNFPTMAAPEGNTNSSKDNRLWANTIRRAVVQGDAQKLRAIAEKLIELAAEGDMSAIKELGDRLDGKASQSIDLGSDPDRPVITKVVREIIDGPKPKDS
jgi:ribosomal protein L17